MYEYFLSELGSSRPFGLLDPSASKVYEGFNAFGGLQPSAYTDLNALEGVKLSAIYAFVLGQDLI